MPLRSNFEPGTSRWATRRAQWRALGLTDEDMTKPKIAIVNSSSQLAICFSHLDEIAGRARRAVEQAGGLAFEVRTAAPSDFITSAGHRGGYILSARDLITNDIEVAVESALLDGMLCLASCDKTAPGQLMAAARLNIPSVIVASGYQPSGTYRGRHCDIEDVFLAAGHVANGKLAVAELTEMSEHAVLGPGVCAGMGTANTMHLACEALGMALPGTTPVRANSEPMWHAVEQAARRVVEMTAEDRRPRDILTPGAFANAVTAVLSVSGSIRGSLAPDGGIVKLAVADDRRLDFAGPAVVFDSPAESLAAVRGGQVIAGQVVVLRGQGPTGSPGMGMASQLVFALDGAGLTGPLALVRDGDLIRIDVPARAADLDVPAAELQRRRGALRRRPAPKSGAGSPSTSAWSVPSRRAPCCESQPHETRPLPSASR